MQIYAYYPETTLQGLTIRGDWRKVRAMPRIVNRLACDVALQTLQIWCVFAADWYNETGEKKIEVNGQ